MFRLTFIVLALSTILFADSFGTTWFIKPDGSGDASTIQAGIDSAVAGDTVSLKNGTYRGDGNRDIDFLGKAIVVRSELGEPSWCIIDCEGSETEYHRGFHLHSGEDSTSVLEGLTIKNGYLGEDDRGAGILCENSSGPTLIKCKLINNIIHYKGKGGGLYCSGATIALSECEFRSNYAQPRWEDGRSYGGGLYVISCTLSLKDCTFFSNSSGFGGGMWCGNSFVSADGCSFSRNIAEYSHQLMYAEGLGGGILSDGDLRMTRCWIVDNVCGTDGGGVNCSGTASFKWCSFSGNFAGTNATGGRGGGVSGDGTFTDCSFFNNTSFLGNGGGVSGDGTFTRCRFEGNGATGGYVLTHGGGVHCKGGTFNDCEFIGNYAKAGGGVNSWIYGGAAAVFTNCLFMGNYSDWGGAGVMAGKGTLTNCTFYDNRAGYGEAFAFEDSVYVENTISAFNTATDTINWWNGVTTLVCCNVYGNEGGDWVGPLAGQDTVNGNFSAHPMFCDPDNGDFTLASISPCLPPNNECGVLVGAYGQGCDYAVGVPDDHAVPPSQAVITAYPNPFNPSTTIEYYVPNSAEVTIRLFDVSGRLVTTLVDRPKTEGFHTVTWHGTDLRGQPASSGIYFVRFESGGQVQTHKIVLLK